jgi:hypothetical protein
MTHYEARCQVPGCAWWDGFHYNSADAQESARQHNYDEHSGKAHIERIKQVARRPRSGILGGTKAEMPEPAAPWLAVRISASLRNVHPPLK